MVLGLSRALVRRTPCLRRTGNLRNIVRGLASVSGTPQAADGEEFASAMLDYDLPPERIALRPCTPRDGSKLLVCDRPGQGAAMSLHDLTFRDVEHLLPRDTLVVLNHSRVITARLHMAKQDTGGAVEVLCVSPVAPSHDPALALRAGSGEAVWRCLLGGKKIKPGMALVARQPPETAQGQEVQFKAVVESRDGRDGILRFWWEGGEGLRDFASVLESFGRVPLPPYMHRPDDHTDKEAYNTVYAHEQGSVAAPTAGLHFTPELMGRMTQHRNVDFCRLTLHVGAGTFQPVEADVVTDHRMHWERFHAHDTALAQLRKAVEGGRPIVPCGTTSVRTLESLYWAGVGLVLNKGSLPPSPSAGLGEEGVLKVGQWDPYEMDKRGAADVTAAEALAAVAEHMGRRGLGAVSGETQLMIMPGYRFALADGLITNFHQPRSTLLLLVGAVCGGLGRVHELYTHALGGPYRFLSFGDSSLLVLPPQCRRQGREPRKGLKITLP